MNILVSLTSLILLLVAGSASSKDGDQRGYDDAYTPARNKAYKSAYTHHKLYNLSFVAII